MSNHQIDTKLNELDKAMTRLRDTMRALPNRLAGFGKQHTEAARKVAIVVTTVEAAKPLFNTDRRGPKARRP
ncbi:hypothetical protein OG439_40350 [Amycolatopsis sp. NBC_01307]|uniref:hypothetical protein n=1 Tax=Amycolatopsis sp. NBC_01307 TaxID=2903561 RepID=UPI002E15D05A|nr:hypothetical protein OG439_40350 [Amycolatopsis sp. NBC_01307]